MNQFCKYVWLILTVLLTEVSVACAGDLTIVADGRSAYSIIVSADAIPAEISAAKELASHIKQISGADLRIVNDSGLLPKQAILLGQPRYLAELAVNPDYPQLGKEGYLIRTVGKHLIIAGGRPRGTLYGVYHLLEKQLGCRWFAPDTSFVPQNRTVTIREQDIVGKPSFAYRDPWMYVGGTYGFWWRDHFQLEYVARTRNSGRQIHIHCCPISDEFGGRFEIHRLDHDLGHLVPGEKYAKDHPEYFALWKGKRTTTGDLELCFSHPDVAAITAETIKQCMRENPDAELFHIGISDTSRLCQCPKCKDAYQKYRRDDLPRGFRADSVSRAGLLLQFANEVAKRTTQEFPDKKIGIFIYGSTFAPPKNIKAHKNLALWFCPIQECTCHPVYHGPANKDLWDIPKILAMWKEVAPHADIYAYEYGSRALSPPDDLFKMPLTVRWYHQQGVKGVLMDAVRNLPSNFGFLRYWLWTQLLNDVNFDFDKGLGEFLQAYYGQAAPQMRRFIELSADTTSYEPLNPKRLNNYFPPDSPQYNDTIHNCRVQWRMPNLQAVEKMYELFEQAKLAVADDPKAMEHLLAARMTLQWVMLECLPGNDPRLPDEAAALLALAKKLEMPDIRGKELEYYRKKISRKIGQHVPKP